MQLMSKSTASFCLGADAVMMTGLEHYIPELVMPGYSITTSLTCQLGRGEPGEVSNHSHHLMAIWYYRLRPRPGDETAESHSEA